LNHYSKKYLKNFNLHKHALLALAGMLLLSQGTLPAQHTAYLPNPTYNPLKVRLNLIILQRKNGAGNFQDNAVDRGFLRNMINVTNGVYADLTNRNEEYYPGQNLPFLSNAKIEFIPNVIFRQDEVGWNNRNDTNWAGVPYLSGWYLDSLDQQIFGSDTLPKAINLYFTTDGQLHEQMVVLGTTTDYDHLVFFKQHAASEIPVTQSRAQPYGKYHTMRCHIGNVWLKLWWKRKVLHEEDWTMEYEVGESIAHELGHLMGLNHTFDAQKHALMRTKFGGLRDYLTTKEIATIHQMFGCYPSLWQFVPDSITYGSPKADWVIAEDATWAQDRRLYANIIIKTGATLSITSEIILPPEGTIVIEPGASLVVNAGLLRRVGTQAPDMYGKIGPVDRRPNIASPYLWESPDLDQTGIVRLMENGQIERAILDSNARK